MDFLVQTGSSTSMPSLSPRRSLQGSSRDTAPRAQAQQAEGSAATFLAWQGATRSCQTIPIYLFPRHASLHCPHNLQSLIKVSINSISSYASKLSQIYNAAFPNLGDLKTVFKIKVSGVTWKKVLQHMNNILPT